MPTTEKLRNKLMAKLTELFQLDQPDLDFGFYRIMQAKARQVKSFIDKDLLQIIVDAFGQADEGRKAELQANIQKEIDAAKSYGVADPDTSPKVMEARARYNALKDGATAESDVYDHLYRFFERYYDEGDFISRRYYARENAGKAAPFAIPYNGEEVKLHWANADQYYIKTAEYFSNYSFDITQAAEIRKMSDGEKVLNCIPEKPLKVHFRIVDASEGEHGNVKAAEDKKRFFILHEEEPVEFNETQELVINFEYKVLPGGKNTVDAEIEKALKKKFGKSLKKGDMPNLAIAEKVIKALGTTEHTEYTENKNINKNNSVSSVYSVLMNIAAPTDKISNRQLLAKYINQYTARNTCDYFIHKDLGGFLKRELDFYIKNEVMHLDDIENADAPAVESYLARLKVIRKLATRLIEFLAQLEDFQKKLWLKKKFVTETNYCITLDRVPEKLYGEIAVNDAQRVEWVKLFAIDEIKGDVGELPGMGKPAYSLPLTTDFLKANDKLVLDTVFFSSDFKAKLIASIEDFDEQCDGLLIHSENFQALNLLQERYREQVKCVYIDPPYNTGSDDNFAYKDNYQHSSWLSMMYDRTNLLKYLMNEQTPLFCSIDQDEWHELRILFSSVFGQGNYVNEIVWQKLTAAKKQSTYFSNIYEKIMVFRNSPEMMLNKIYIQSDKDDSNYPYIEEGTGRRYGSFDFTQKGKGEARMFNGKLLSPPQGKHWIWGQDKIDEGITDNRIIFTRNGTPRVKRYLDEKEGNAVGDFWIDEAIKPLSANDSERIGFDTQKPLCLLYRVLNSAFSDELVIDYFAGSGTTGHAVINLNRQDASTGSAQAGKRKYILVEMGDYFDTVLKPRITKVIYSSDWKDGKSTSRDSGISHCFKYIRLESYEDTLNNLVFDENPVRNKAIESNPSLKEDYMLRYLLDVETRGSQSLLNIDAFADPTAYSLTVKKPGSDEQVTQNIDLIETFNYLLGLRLENMAAPQTFTASFTRKPDPELPQDQHTKLVVDGKIKSITNEQVTMNKKGESDHCSLSTDHCKTWWFRKLEGWVPADPMNPNNGRKERVLIVWRRLTGNLEEDNLMLDQWFLKYRISTRDFEYDTIYVNGSNNLPNLKKDDENWKVRLIEEEFHKKMWSTKGV